MFQPSEITNKNVSAFDRMRPIDIKPKSIRATLSENLPKMLQKKTITQKQENKLMDKLAEYYNDYNGHKESYVFSSRDKNVNWYQRARNATNRIVTFMPNVNLEILEQCILEHMLDWMNNNEKNRLYNEIFFNKNGSQPKIEDIKQKIKEIVLKLQANLEIDDKITLKNIKKNIETIEKQIKKKVKHTKQLEEHI